MPALTLRRLSLLTLWTGAVILGFAAPAWAVIPGITGPMQTLCQALPQLLPFVFAGIAGALSSQRWRGRLSAAAKRLGTPAGAGRVLLILAVAGSGLLLLRPGDRSETAAASVTAGSAAGSEWTMFRATLSRSGAARDASGPARGEMGWSFTDPGARVADYSSSPAAAGGRIYIGCGQSSLVGDSGMVYCLDAATGRRIWQFQARKPVFSSPAVAGGRVFVGEGLHQDRRCNLYCLDAATGKKLWATETKSHTESSPAVDSGRVYAGAGDDGLYCLDAGSGSVIWHYPDAHVDGSPAVAEGVVYAGSGYGSAAAIALDAASGRLLWSTPCDVPVWGPPAVSGGRVYYGIGNGDFVKSAPRPRGGSGVWERRRANPPGVTNCRTRWSAPSSCRTDTRLPAAATARSTRSTQPTGRWPGALPAAVPWSPRRLRTDANSMPPAAGATWSA
jgi:hypothetical protein